MFMRDYITENYGYMQVTWTAKSRESTSGSSECDSVDLPGHMVSKFKFLQQHQIFRKYLSSFSDFTAD
jgi:hypothetical protein